MTDLEELRRTLRAQESLAPEPGEVFDAATRRIRRNRTAGVTAVTLTVAAALGAGTAGMLSHGTATVPPASGPAATRSSGSVNVPPAAPAVSLADSSWQLMLWAVQPGLAVVHYGQGHQYAFEIQVHDGPVPRGALAAKPSTAEKISDPQLVIWQDGPGRWMLVRTTKPLTAAEMLTLLGKIRTTPPVVNSPLKSVRVPDGQRIDSFTSEPEANTLVLCPAPAVGKVPLDSGCFSLVVSSESRSSMEESATPQDPLPAHQYRTLGAYTIEIDSSHANEPAALNLLNSVQLNR